MKLIQRSNLKGEITAPESKSITQRVMICDFFAGRFNYEISETAAYDIQTAYIALKNIQDQDEYIDIGESGFCFRTLPIIASLYREKNRFIISKSLVNRPNIEFLKKIGYSANIIQNVNNQYIFTVKGKITAGSFHINGNITSQIISGMLFCLPSVMGESELIINDLNSKGYIDLTIDILKKYSIEIQNDNYKTFKIKGNQNFTPVENCVENLIKGDWSGAAFMISAGAVAAENSIFINGLDFNSKQADKAVLQILDNAGVQYCIKENTLLIEKSEVKAFSFDCSDCPDLVPALVPLAINSNDICLLKNITRLKYKESDRISNLISEYGKCGIKIKMVKNDLQIEPGGILGADLNSYNDHRIAMSLAVSALNSIEPIKIEDDNCVSKSYPQFWNDLTKLGAKIYE